MEVLMGPTFGIEVRDRSGVAGVPNATDQLRVATCLFLKDDVGVTGKAMEPEDDSSSTSSIGAPDDSEDEDNDDVSSKEVRSGFNGGGFASLGSLEDSLPIKRGLSNHFIGKSKSFANLSEVSTVRDLEKPENAFNKRRRLLVASRFSSSRRSSFYSSFNPKSMPLLALKEDEDEDYEQHQEKQGYPSSSSSSSSPSSSSSSSLEKKEREDDRQHQERLPKTLLDKRLLNLKSRSCFSLSDLQEHDEQDDD